MALFWAAWAAAYGAVLGSFACVVISRVPEGRTVTGRSACDGCGGPVGGFNVPVAGWLWLRGRARCCGAAIPGWLPAVEAGMAACFAAAAAAPVAWWASVAMCAAALGVVVAAGTAARTRRLHK